MALLEIENLHAEVGRQGDPAAGSTLSVPAGEVHAIMGPNGSGKSTLSYVLSGREGYEITGGTVTFNGKDLLALQPEERAAAGIFLAFQYPVEIPGVPNATFLRTALNADPQVRRGRGEKTWTRVQFMRAVMRDKSAKLGIDARDDEAPDQCRFLRRREEAQRNPADGDAGAQLCDSG